MLFYFVCSVAWTTEFGSRFFLRFCSSSSLRFARCHHGRRGRSTARSSRYRTPMEIAFRSASAQLFQRKSKHLSYLLYWKRNHLITNQERRSKYYKLCDVLSRRCYIIWRRCFINQPQNIISYKRAVILPNVCWRYSLALLYIECTVRASPRDWSSAAIEYVYQPEIPRCVGQWAQHSLSSFT